jgi:hypothetical protein
LSIIAGLAVLAGGAALTAILAMAFDRLNLVYATGLGESIVLLRSPLFMWIVIACPVGLLVALVASDAVEKRMTGPPPPRNLRAGYGLISRSENRL